VIRTFFLCCVFSSFLVFANNSDSADSNDFTQASHSSRGGIGLINTPTARFSDDGEFELGVSLEAPYQRIFAKMQFFPWMEAVLKYTKGYNQPYIAWSESEAWTDKGIDVKFRLLEEGNPPFDWLPERMIPELAVGLRDFGGTGAYSAEFVVASKRFNNIDLTLGLGWGALSGVDHVNSPLGWFNNFLSRIEFGDALGKEANLQHGGGINFGTFFEEDRASIFGGIEYFTPVPGLSVKLEYDTNEYPEGTKLDYFDPESRDFRMDSRVSAALNYRLYPTERDAIDLSLGYVHGNTLYASFSVHSNFNFTDKAVRLGAERLIRPSMEPYSKLDADWKKYLTDSIFWQLGNVGVVTHRLIFNGNELQAEISQGRFRRPILAIDLASRVISNNAPTDIEKITIINVDAGIETLRATVSRPALFSAALRGGLDESDVEFSTNDSLDRGALIVDNDVAYPHFSWSIQPILAGTLQHPEKFYFWQLQAMARGILTFRKGLHLQNSYTINILNNYDEGYDYHWPDGELYHVRQNRRQYITGEGSKFGMTDLSLHYFADLHPNVKGVISAGYLEMMFGGIGGEVIYMPDHKQWALGFDTYWLKQRDFDQKFGFQDFETVTAFLSYYYELPFYNMRFKINWGRFLAKDVGVHLDLSRRFNTGARVGAIVALTDCDPDCVGEGSFNKWIYFSFPMENWTTIANTRSKSHYSWSPLTKDAAQKVTGGGELYFVMTDAKDEVDILRKKPWSVKKILSGFGTSPKKKI
tara:strand:- start:185 stop:2449 length:2265 start_codon:yes stop_codon:yes gene_type:complete